MDLALDLVIKTENMYLFDGELRKRVLLAAKNSICIAVRNNVPRYIKPVYSFLPHDFCKLFSISPAHFVVFQSLYEPVWKTIETH